MGRLAGTLREYEALTAELEVKLRDVDDASEAIHRTFVAAQRTRDEMITEAKRRADELLESARLRSDELLRETETQLEAMLAKAAADADRLYAAATTAKAGADQDAEQMRLEAEEILEIAKATAVTIQVRADEVLTGAIADAEARTEEAHDVLATHRRQAEATLRAAADEAAQLGASAATAAEQVTAGATHEATATLAAARREAETLIAASLSEAKELRSSAQTEIDELHAVRSAEAEALVTAADARADTIVATAERTKQQLERRNAQLRTAIADIERALRKLAATALARTGMIGEMVDLEHHTIDLTDSPREEETVSGETIDTPDRPSDADNERPPPADLAETTAIDTIGGPIDLAAVIEPIDTFDAMTRRRSELEALARLVRARTVAFAEPDGSGRPPAARRLLDPDATPMPGDGTETIYQRRARGLRARLREKGQDPTQRGR
jgi:hypothetical protein